MALPSIFIDHLLVDWFDRVSFFSLYPIYPSVSQRLKFGRAPRILDPATFFPFFPGSVVPLCEATLAPRPEREQATLREAAPGLCSTSHVPVLGPASARSEACSCRPCSPSRGHGGAELQAHALAVAMASRGRGRPPSTRQQRPRPLRARQAAARQLARALAWQQRGGLLARSRRPWHGCLLVRWRCSSTQARA